jgi:hypothetical protein
MSLNRRHLMQLSAAAMAALAVGRDRAVAAPASRGAIDKAAAGYLHKHGYTALPPLDLITGLAFNGGLRFDPFRPDAAQSRRFIIQRVARIDDIALRNRPGVLVSYNVIFLQDPEPPARGALFMRVMDFLVNARGFDPAKMQFLSTDVFVPHLEKVKGARAKQFTQLSEVQARNAGRGAGVFAPKGHPDALDFASVNVYYPVGAGAAGHPVAFAPEGFAEIALIGIGPGGGKLGASEVAGIGVERLAMAEGAAAPSFEQSRIALLRALEAEAKAKAQGKTLPPGYAALAAL